MMEFDLNEVYNFLKANEVFFVSTVNGDRPACRPFGAVMEYDNNLYISTGKTKEVYKQIKCNPYIQINAVDRRTREWVRVEGTAEEVEDLDMKQKMIKECPILTKHFSEANDEEFALIKIKVMDVKFA